MTQIVDLRSDTVTRPTPEMYEAMRTAPLGDDVLGDEPTVRRLEELSADMLGKEASLFLPSGTMGNQIALAVHCRPGDAILLDEDAHILYYEVGAPALIAGVVSWTLPSDRGIMDPEYLEARVLKQSLHTPGTKLLCVENTHNRGGGSVIPLDKMRAYRGLCDRHGMRLHLDGARVFNAAAALGVPVREIADTCDTVNFCLSKGLGAPVGSMLCGPKEFIAEARIWRKRLGGGMRQSGLLAACGIVSLTKMVDRLEDDHRRTRQLADALRGLPGLQVNVPETNMVLVETDLPAVELQAKLEEQGVWCLPMGTHRLRFVLHADIDDAGVSRAIQAFERVTCQNR
jgi:threonine aldolase